MCDSKVETPVNMSSILTPSVAQYLHPDYLQPLPTTVCVHFSMYFQQHFNLLLWSIFFWSHLVSCCLTMLVRSTRNREDTHKMWFLFASSPLLCVLHEPIISFTVKLLLTTNICTTGCKNCFGLYLSDMFWAYAVTFCLRLSTRCLLIKLLELMF